MLKGLDFNKLATKTVNLEELESRIKTGNALLITGAGFSLDCENLLGNKPPLASGLALKLCERFNLARNENLKYVSDICLNYGEKRDVLEVLQENFELTSVSSANNKICSIPWRRIYTTNYDNSVELGYLNNKKNILSLSLVDSPSDYLGKGKDNEMCIHLNGAIKNATEDDLAYKIKLSDSSYLSADFFLESKWRAIFNKDVEHCSAIVFVGYSLYDIDIEKILFDRPHLADKTYFITRPDSTHEQIYKLSSYGHILKVGTEGFGDIVNGISFEEDTDNLPDCFTRIVIGEEKSILDDFSTKQLLLYGHYNRIDIDTAWRSGFEIPYMFKRSQMDTVCSYLKSKKHVLLQSGLGNGKTILVEHVSTALVNDGYSVWKMSDFEGNPSKDLEIFTKFGEHILIIDDINDQHTFFEYFSALSPDNITFLISDRSVNSFENIKNLVDDDINIVALDKLDQSERLQLIHILEDQNMWKKYTGFSNERKHKLISEKYNNHLSNILIGLLESPDIKGRIESILQEFVLNDKYKKTLFTIALCDIFGIRKEAANVADIAGNETLLTASFRNTIAFKTLFTFGESNSIITKSSVLSLFLVNNFFAESYVVENCLEIMKRIDGDQSSHVRAIRSKLLTFNNLEKLIPQKQNSLNNYFAELKRRCLWLKKHPHYWVQYAMCRLSFGDTKIAQEHLDSAYKFASLRKDDYHTENIDTQQARLFIMKAIENISDPANAAKLFENANKLLNSIKNDNQKFRQVIKYQGIYESLHHLWRPKKQVMFEQACKAMKAEANLAFDIALPTERTKFIEQCKVVLTEILEDIVKKRGSLQ
jgi:hypothetical protein